MMDLKNLFSDSLFSLCQIGVCLPFENGSAIEKRIASGCATPKENINRKSASVDEEHFLVFCLAVLSIWDTELPKGQKNVMDDENFQ